MVLNVFYQHVFYLANAKACKVPVIDHDWLELLVQRTVSGVGWTGTR